MFEIQTQFASCCNFVADFSDLTLTNVKIGKGAIGGQRRHLKLALAAAMAFPPLKLSDFMQR